MSFIVFGLANGTLRFISDTYTDEYDVLRNMDTIEDKHCCCHFVLYKKTNSLTDFKHMYYKQRIIASRTFQGTEIMSWAPHSCYTNDMKTFYFN